MQNKRPSNMPRLMTCSASYLEPKVPINGDDIFAISGTTAHDCIENMLRGNSIDHYDTEYRIQAYMVRKFLDSLGDIEILGIEERFYWEIEGTADLVFSFGDTLVILDWKSGYKVKNYDWQVRCYGIGAMLKYKKFKKFKTITYYTRLSEFDVVDYDREELEGYKALLLASEYKDDFTPSEHCDYCPRKWECPALIQQNQYLLETFKADPTQNLVDVFGNFKKSQAILADFDKIVKARMKTMVYLEGTVEEEEGIKKLVQKKQKKATLKAEIVLDALLDKGIDIKDIMKFFSVSKTKLSDLLEKHGVNNPEFMKELKEKGGVTEKEFFKIKVEYVKEKTDGNNVS